MSATLGTRKPLLFLFSLLSCGVKRKGGGERERLGVILRKMRSLEKLIIENLGKKNWVFEFHQDISRTDTHTEIHTP